MARVAKIALVLLWLACAWAAEPAPTAPNAQKAATHPGRAGAATCARCHAEETRLWTESAHGKHGTAVERPKGGADGAVGSQWMQAYLRKGEDGYHRIQLRCFDLREKKWASVAPVLDTIRGPWPGAKPTTEAGVAQRDFEVSCSGCHSSGSKLRIDPATGKMRSHWDDLSIDCESCHGPGAAHATAWSEPRGDTPMPRLDTLTPRVSAAVCGRCHGGPPADGDFAPKDAAEVVNAARVL